MDWPSSPLQSDDEYAAADEEEEEEEEDVSPPDQDADGHVSPSTSGKINIEHNLMKYGTGVGDSLNDMVTNVSHATADTPSHETPTRKQPPKQSVASPTEWDCICDRGKFAMNHSGNKRLRRLVTKNLERYRNSTTKTEKSEIQIEIVSVFRHTGRFLEEDKHTGRWYHVDDENASRRRRRKEKISIISRSYFIPFFFSFFKTKYTVNSKSEIN